MLSQIKFFRHLDLEWLKMAVLGYQPLAQEQEADLNDAFINSDLTFKVYIVIW